MTDGGLLVIQNAEPEVRAFGAEFIEGGGQVGKLRAYGGLGHDKHLTQ